MTKWSLVGLFVLSATAAAQPNIVTLQTAIAGQEPECVSRMPSDALQTLVQTALAKRSGERCVVAYIEPSNELLNATGGLIVSGPSTGKARRAALKFQEGSDVKQWPGRISHIEEAGGFVLVGADVAIDAQAWTIFDGALTERGRVYGLRPLVLPGGVILYQRGQPHFAPTHYIELAGYDTKSRVDADLFPRTPHSPVRLSFIRRTQAAYDRPEFDCRGRNHHCDGERFDSSITAVAVAINGRAIAFLVDYGSDDERLPPETVMATCDGFPGLARVRCRETPVQRWREAFPGVPDAKLPTLAAERPRLIAASGNDRAPRR